MTLTTHIAIVEPTPVKAVFDECRRILGGEHVAFEHKPSWRDGQWQYRNRAGQGLHALLWIYYGVDAPITPTPEEDDDPDWRKYYPPIDQWSIEVCFDTAYSYRGPNGGGCGDLHAWLIQQLGRWLSEHGLTWYWQHEYDGTWHQADELAILGDPERGRLPTAEAVT